jgi:hypothetical protein
MGYEIYPKLLKNGFTQGKITHQHRLRIEESKVDLFVKSQNGFEVRIKIVIN